MTTRMMPTSSLLLPLLPLHFVLFLVGQLPATTVAQPLADFNQCAAFAPPVVLNTNNRKLYNSVTGEYVAVKGVNYYPRPNAGPLTLTNSIDFTTDEFANVWQRDVARFVQLGVNVVRLYAVQPGVSHDAFMCALKQAGIYVIVGLAADCADCAIAKDAAPPACYPAALRERGQFIIAEFARYDNVLAFSAGNEVSLATPSANGGANGVFYNGACQKQFIRDMRQYIADCRNTIRPIPVGLAIADIQRAEKALWYNCRSDATDILENAEFIGVNSYLHCDGALGADDVLPGMAALLSDFASYGMTVPVMLTEFGCVDPSFSTIDDFQAQRNWLQVQDLFAPEYRAQFVGGVVFEYNTEAINSAAPYPFTTYGPGNFGLGRFDPMDCDDVDIPCTFTPFPQFDTLTSRYAAVDTSEEVTLQNLIVTGEEIPPPTCPAGLPRLDSFQWPVVNDRECPGEVFVQCPDTTFPVECTNLGIQLTGAFLDRTLVPSTTPTTASPAAMLPTAVPTEIPTEMTTDPTSVQPTESPTESPVMTNGPTAMPVMPTLSPSSAAPSALPTGQPSDPSPLSTSPSTTPSEQTTELISEPSPLSTLPTGSPTRLSRQTTLPTPATTTDPPQQMESAEPTNSLAPVSSAFAPARGPISSCFAILSLLATYLFYLF